MPAIRYKSNGIMVIADQTPNHKSHMVDILTKEGELTRVKWLGFICTAATKFFDNGGIAKMDALEVTQESMWLTAKWDRVPKGQYVLCWRIPHIDGGTSQVGVYAIVDDSGMPITIAG